MKTNSRMGGIPSRERDTWGKAERCEAAPQGVLESPRKSPPQGDLKPPERKLTPKSKTGESH